MVTDAQGPPGLPNHLVREMQVKSKFFGPISQCDAPVKLMRASAMNMRKRIKGKRRQQINIQISDSKDLSIKRMASSQSTYYSTRVRE